MKKILLIIFFLSSFLCAETLLLKIKDKPVLLKSGSNKTGIAFVDGILNDQVKSVSAMFPENFENNELDNWIKIELAEENSAEIINQLLESGDVEYCGVNHTLKLDYTKSDPRLDEQWGLEQCGALKTWDYQRGSNDVIVAIIDTGIDYLHEDLHENIWINSAEDLNGNGIYDEADENGIDDDVNGFVDDVMGWDFTDAPNYHDGGDYLDRDNDPMDEMGHGTAVAGIVAAMTDNEIGIGSVAPNCSVMNLRAFTIGGNGEEDDVASAILYAINNGASVINMSFGDVFVSRVIHDVINYAAEMGVVLVASAGNSSTDQIHYPSGYEGVISVGAIDSDGNLASFSNYGPTIDIVAPGVDILTTDLDNEYSSYNGTSFSAPFVSAGAALLLSEYDDLTPESVRGILTNSASSMTVNNNWDIYFASGSLDVNQALQSPVRSIVKIDQPLLDNGFEQGEVTVTGSAWSPFFDHYELLWGEGHDPSQWTHFATAYEPVIDGELGALETTQFQEGEYTIKLLLFHKDGSQHQSAVRIFVDSSAPQFSNTRFFEMLDGHNYSTMVQFQTDDLAEGALFYRDKDAGDFQKIPFAYRTYEHRYNLTPGLGENEIELYLSATNGADLTAVNNNSGQNFSVDLSKLPIPSDYLTLGTGSIPKGYVLPETFDFDGNGLPEIILSKYNEGSIGHIYFYENGDEVASIKENLIPRDLGDVNGDGIPELLCGFGFSSKLFTSDATNSFPQKLLYDWQGDGSTQYWASRITDLDKDDKKEIVMRLVDAETDGFVLLEYNQNEFIKVAEFPNPTNGQNSYGVPHCQTGDFDNDGQTEVVFGDSDGDIYIYENTGDNQYTVTWQDSLPLLDTIGFIASGDFNGDGIDEFTCGSHSDPNLNTEHYYDARHWYYTVYENNGDNSFERKAEWRIFGYESTKDFDSGVSAGDVDNDGDDEVFICAYPDMYAIDYKNGEYELVYHSDFAEINAPIIVDSDNDGYKEVWFGDTQKINQYLPTTNTSGIPVPVGFMVFPLDEHSVKLFWRGSSSENVYKIFRGSFADDLTVLSEITDHSFVDTNLTTNEKYYYAIQSVLDEKTSPMTSTLGATPNPQPWLQKAEQETAYSIRLTFSEPMSQSVKQPVHYFSDKVGYPSSVAHDKSGQQVILSFQKTLPVEPFEITCTNLFDTQNTPIDTVHNQGFVTLLKQQTAAPYLVKAVLVNQSKVDVYFNESMDASSCSDADNFDFGNMISVDDATLDQVDKKVVHVLLNTSVPIGAFGKTYTINVADVKNENGIEIVPGVGDHLNLIFSAENLDHVFTYPNPWHSKLENEEITFANLTLDAKIVIMTERGLPIRTLNEKNGDGGVMWDTCDSDGNKVASGIYIYHVSNDKESVMGKLAVVR